MVIGVPKEIKRHEYRIGMAPAGARELVEAGHVVIVQSGAGEGSDIGDDEFRQAGARLVGDAGKVYAEAETIVKVKEPLPSEYDLLRPGQILFTFLHLAPAPELTRALLDSGVTGVAYETVQLDNGSLPLLQPMSEVAGRLSVQAGAHFLQKENGGRGVLLSGVPGVRRGKVVIIGGGTVGSNALRIAVGMGADVTVLDTDPSVLGHLEDRFHNRIRTLISNPRNIEDEVAAADLVIGAVLVAGARAPILVSRELVSRMRAGSVMVDVAVDQGGCVETSRATTPDNPVFSVHGVLHYGVANMPGAVSRTSTFALTNRTLPYLRRIADLGLSEAARGDEALRRGINTFDGTLCNEAVAEALDLPWEPYNP